MNRIILIGNGFDLAHGLPTRYEDFINWYWEKRITGLASNTTQVDTDKLCVFKIDPALGYTWQYLLKHLKSQKKSSTQSIKEFIEEREDSYKIVYSVFFSNICKSIKTKDWVDIENEYYRLLIQCAVDNKSIKCTVEELNGQLNYLQNMLVLYLLPYNKRKNYNGNIKDFIYEPIRQEDISILGKSKLVEHIQYWLQQNEEEWKKKLRQYELDDMDSVKDLCQSLWEYSKKKHKESTESLLEMTGEYYKEIGFRPDNVLFLNFNYTSNAEQYLIKDSNDYIRFNYIHGKLTRTDSVIFGYGDELDEKYNNLVALNDNECLRNMKSVKYLESSNYRDMLSFIESAPYQVYIMGHSCGNSDRTLLNTLFEHRNCVSIKPFYYKKDKHTDNYLDLVQNISRNFTDMKLMRDRVVNKTFCSPLPQC